jgi:hypothetical protein
VSEQQTSSLAEQVLGWLRAGYPDGIPPRDFPTVLGVLQRRLTKDEIHSIAAELAAQSAPESPISREDIERLVSETVLQPATDDNVAQVSARLAAGGWPLADPHDPPPPD